MIFIYNFIKIKMLNNFSENKKQLYSMVVLCLVSLLVYFKTSSDPIFSLIQGTFLESFFYQFAEGNNILNALSIGILVSSIFWYLNIYLPENRVKNSKLKRLNKALMLIIEAKNGNPYSWDKHYIHCLPFEKKHLIFLKEVKDQLDNKKIYNSLAEKAFYEICESSFELFNFLSITANEVSPKHGELWDSMARNIAQIGKFYPEFHRKKIDSGWRLGDKKQDFSSGLFELNMTELLEKIEKWIDLD